MHDLLEMPLVALSCTENCVPIWSNCCIFVVGLSKNLKSGLLLDLKGSNIENEGFVYLNSE